MELKRKKKRRGGGKEITSYGEKKEKRLPAQTHAKAQNQRGAEV